MITQSIHDGDLDGTFGVPDGGGPFPGVLALGGSEGGIPEYLLQLLVPEGFACLALAYFGTRDTQPALVEVPLERIERGLRWMLGQSAVAADETAIPIECAAGPMLLISGDNDGVWPTTRMCTMLTERMRNAGRATSIRHLSFPDAGHALFPYPGAPEQASEPIKMDFGGSDESAEAAHMTAWPEVIEHLRATSC